MAKGVNALLDFLRRDGDSSNTVIGIILLVMLLVFIGPNVLPSFLSRTFTFVDEGIPCTRLRQAEDRGNHQSLIGRATRNPISLRVNSTTIPTDPNGILIIRITIENETIGSVPVVFDERQVIVGDDGVSSGFGLIFTPNSSVTLPNIRQTAGGVINDGSIRILGPRQRCVHRIEIPRNSLDATLLSGSATVQAYYRINTVGVIAGGLYPDHGLALIDGGFLVSEPVPILNQVFNATAQ